MSTYHCSCRVWTTYHDISLFMQSINPHTLWHKGQFAGDPHPSIHCPFAESHKAGAPTDTSCYCGPYWWYFIQYSWGTGQSNGFWSTGYCSPNKHWFLGIAKDKPCFPQTDPLNFTSLWSDRFFCTACVFMVTYWLLIAKEFVFLSHCVFE